MPVAIYQSPKLRKIYGSDPREIPLYSINEVARYVKIHEQTLRSWIKPRDRRFRGKNYLSPPVIQPVSPSRLSFINLLEAFVLSSLTKIERLSMIKVRRALEVLQEVSPSLHPWLDNDFLTNRFDLFIQMDDQLVNLSRGGQIEFESIIKAHLTRISRDIDLSPVKVFPFARELHFDVFKSQPDRVHEILESSSRNIEVDPLIAFGRPTLAGTGIPVEVIASRARAGDKVSFLANDYGLTEEQIQEAVAYESRPLKAA